MDTSLPFQVTRLLAHEDVRRQMVQLTQAEYDSDVRWIEQHFAFRPISQWVDPSHDSTALVGSVDDLNGDTLLGLFAHYQVAPQERVHLMWSIEQFGVSMPLALVSKYLLSEIWYPATDDVLIPDPVRGWLFEAHHEGMYYCVRARDTLA